MEKTRQLIKEVERKMLEADEINIGILPKEDIQKLVSYNKAVNRLLKHIKV